MENLKSSKSIEKKSKKRKIANIDGHEESVNISASIPDTAIEPIANDEKIMLVNDKDPATKRKNKEGRHLTCLMCREDGHVAKNCRLNKGKKIDLSICFNCGSRDHILKECTKPKSSSLSYATCFICKKEGHIAKDCPDNPNGLYPKGGCCHICQLKTHFSRDCPKKHEQNKKRVGFSSSTSSTAKSTTSTTTAPMVSKGDDEIDDEPFYEVEDLTDENKEKRRKFDLKNKYYAKPKPNHHRK